MTKSYHISDDFRKKKLELVEISPINIDNNLVAYNIQFSLGNKYTSITAEKEQIKMLKQKLNEMGDLK